MTQRQEIHCHNCDKWVQFRIDLELDGNHVLECPNCKHEHCRVVKKGEITDIRWDQRNGPTFQVAWYSNVTTSSSTMYIPYANASTSGQTMTTYYTTDLWMSTSS